MFSHAFPRLAVFLGLLAVSLASLGGDISSYRIIELETVPVAISDTTCLDCDSETEKSGIWIARALPGGGPGRFLKEFLVVSGDTIVAERTSVHTLQMSWSDSSESPGIRINKVDTSGRVWFKLVKETADNCSGKAIPQECVPSEHHSFRRNNIGQVVGNMLNPASLETGNDSQVQVAYLKSTPLDVQNLNTLRNESAVSAGWFLADALDINNQQWIVGTGSKADTDSHFLAVPVAPGSEG